MGVRCGKRQRVGGLLLNFTAGSTVVSRNSWFFSENARARFKSRIVERSGARSCVFFGSFHFWRAASAQFTATVCESTSAQRVIYASMNFLVISSRTSKCLSGVLFVFPVERVFRPVLASFSALICILIYVIFYTYTQGQRQTRQKR